MLLTFKQVKDSRIIQVAAACSNSDDFRSLVNEATEMLLVRGDFVGTVIPVYLCVRDGCITMPRYCRQIRQLNICGKHIQINSLWYQFVDSEFYKSWCGSNGTWNGSGRAFDWGASWGHNGLNAVGYYSTYSNVPLPSYIRAYAQVLEDVGKTVTIFGEDENGQPLRTNNGDGTWSDGVVITLAMPWGQTTTLVRKITRVLKDPSQGNVLLYALDPATNTLFDLAVYQPSETNPNYARYYLNGMNRGCHTGCTVGVLALIKLAYIPVEVDSDLVLIGNLRALKFAIQSIKASEAGNDGAATEFELKAIRELNLELANDQPDNQVTFVDETFSGAKLHGTGVRRIF